MPKAKKVRLNPSPSTSSGPVPGAGSPRPAPARKDRDRAILLSAGVILGILFLLGLVAPALISMKSTLGAVLGFALLSACLIGIAMIVDRLVLRFWP